MTLLIREKIIRVDIWFISYTIPKQMQEVTKDFLS